MLSYALFSSPLLFCQFEALAGLGLLRPLKKNKTMEEAELPSDRSPGHDDDTMVNVVKTEDTADNEIIDFPVDRKDFRGVLRELRTKFRYKYVQLLLKLLLILSLG